MKRKIYEYSKGNVSLFLDKFAFLSRDIYNNFSCLGRTEDVMRDLNMETARWIRRDGKEMNIWVHGIFQNYHRFLKNTVDWFRERDIAMVSIGYDYHDPIKKSAEDLSRGIDFFKKESGVDKINLVGISYGGCVTRSYVGNLFEHEKVDKLITICSPYSKIKKNCFGYWFGKVAGRDSEDRNVFYNKFKVDHFAIHALNDFVIGSHDISDSSIKRFFVPGGHHPSSGDPRKLELVEKILKDEIF